MGNVYNTTGICFALVCGRGNNHNNNFPGAVENEITIREEATK
jgi:hypothetical protein